MAPPPAFEDATAMLYVLMSKPDSISLDEFTDWYDNEHAPLRKPVSGVLNVRRFELRDSNPPCPEWLAVYELNSPFVLKSRAYNELWKTQSDREKDVLGKIENSSRRVYHLFSRRSRADYSERQRDDEETKKKRVLQTIALEPAKSSDMTDDEFDEWYHEEHLDDLHRVPGWLRSTRWVLQDVKGPGLSEVEAGKKPPKFLAIHEYEDESFRDSKEFKEANDTPKRLSILPNLEKNAERGYWKLWKEF